jgi:hypothetical protein
LTYASILTSCRMETLLGFGWEVKTLRNRTISKLTQISSRKTNLTCLKKSKEQPSSKQRETKTIKGHQLNNHFISIWSEVGRPYTHVRVEWQEINKF